jgi:hypothetical protein
MACDYFSLCIMPVPCYLQLLSTTAAFRAATGAVPAITLFNHALALCGRNENDRPMV